MKLCLLLFLWQAPGGPVHSAVPQTSKDTGRVVSYHYRLIARPDRGYGYTILAGSKILIRQESIPGLPGNRAFTTKADAARVAALVIHKLEQKIFPPTVTSAELERLHIW